MSVYVFVKYLSTFLTLWITFQVLMSVPCVLVTPKRKLAGRLAIMKDVVHLFGEFLVEGTGGSSVFKSFDSSGNFDQCKFEELVGVEKQKFVKLPISSDLYSVSGRIMDCIGDVRSDVLQEQHKNIKRHRRWNISKVLSLYNILFYMFRSLLFLMSTV